MKLRFDTLVIFVQDLAVLRHFYTDILGLEIVEEMGDDWLLLDAGAAHLGLHRIGEAYRHSSEEPYQFDNNTKLVFETQDDLSQLRDFLAVNGAIVHEIKTFPDYDFLLFDGQDPEGNVFQIKQRKG
ncbi:MAG: VOC family protein [Spirosomataceae bacterium]